MSHLNWPSRADLMFDQIETLISNRIHTAEFCLRSEVIVTNIDEYRGKIKTLRDVQSDLSVMRRVWLGSVNDE